MKSQWLTAQSLLIPIFGALLTVPMTYGQRSLRQIMAKRPPRLVVVVVIDQFRADYLTRFNDLFLPHDPASYETSMGGFRLLMQDGAWFVNAHLQFVPTFTGPGHAVIATGSPPSVNGIIANRWYNEATEQVVDCVRTPAYSPVRAYSFQPGAAPSALLVTTLGDELRMTTGGQSRVVSIGFKDRAAVLMGGHIPTAVLWYDDNNGEWISSSYYTDPDDLYPWARELNEKRIVDDYFRRSWELDPQIDYRTRQHAISPVPWCNPPAGFGFTFPHQLIGNLEKDALFYQSFALTPFANAHLFDTAKAVINAEQLGANDVPDLLWLSLASNDYVGHTFGPYSLEVVDITVKTDRQLADLFRFLDRTVPGGIDEVLIVLTSDHGIAPAPPDNPRLGQQLSWVSSEELIKAADAALDEKFGDTKWVSAFVKPNLYFKSKTIRKSLLDPAGVQTTAAAAMMRLPSVMYAFTRSQIMNGRLPPTAAAEAVYHGFHPDRSGDVVVVLSPGWQFSGAVAGRTYHGSLFPYDTHVPILMRGPGVQAGIYPRRVALRDIAPTLALILGITAPSGSVGDVLTEAVKTE